MSIMQSPNVFSSVLLNSNGIIRKVHTTYFSICTPVQIVGRYITLYTFSPAIASLFKESIPHHFAEDDNEPATEQHSALQQVILYGSKFIHRSKLEDHINYAELVIYADKTLYTIDDLLHTLHSTLNMYNKNDHHACWKPFAWRKFCTSDSNIIAVSVEKLCVSN